MTKQFLIWNGKYYNKVELNKEEFESIMNNQEKPVLNLDGEMVLGKEFSEE